MLLEKQIEIFQKPIVGGHIELELDQETWAGE
jgi:hypothetical protein